MNRRRVATLIRVRQEIHKRVDALRFRSFERTTARSVLRAGPAGVIDDGAADGLRDALARAAQGRFPRRDLAQRDAASLPGRDVLLADAERIATGTWDVFGTALSVDASSFDWTRHPFTGVAAGDAHWSRVAYMRGVGGGDVKQIWELSRHGQLLRLAQAYYLTRDARSLETLLLLLDRWIAQNPAGQGVNWTSSLEVAFRSIAWCWIWALTCDSRAWSRARVERFLAMVWHHGWHVERYDSVHHSPNTHLTGEALGLLYLGLFFPELRRADRWVRLATNILNAEIEPQILTDGMHYERSTGYHRYTLEFYLHYLLLAEAFGLEADPRLRERVHALAAASWLIRRPDGTWPVIGDEDSGSTLLLTPTPPQDQAPLLGLASALCDEPAWRPADPAALGAGWWLLSPERWSAVRDGHPPTDAVETGALRTAGYYVGRAGAMPDAWYCLVDAGPHGGERTGHAHTDLGHVEIAHGTTHLVADPGCPAYTIDPGLRDRCRSEFVHACLVLDDAPLATPDGPFAWTTVSPEPRTAWGSDRLWYCELAYDRSHPAGSLRHRRQVVLVPGAGVVVCDWIDGDRPSSLALHWPLGVPASTIGVPTDGGLLAGGHTIQWTSTPTVMLSARTEPFVTAPGYGRSVAGQLLRIAADGSLPLAVVTVFAERSANFVVHVADDGEVAMRVRTADDESSIVVCAGRPPAYANGADVGTAASNGGRG